MASIYEQPDLLSQYLHFHYAGAGDYLPWASGPDAALGFPVRCADKLIGALPDPGRSHVLDLGCAVGRSAFALSEVVESVTAVDHSSAFVETAQRLAREGSVDYEMALVAGRPQQLQARLPDAARPGRVRFVQADACALPDALGMFDGVLLANVLCRLTDPLSCLRQLTRLVRPCGVVLVTSPGSWNEAFTPRERWLNRNGSTLDGVGEFWRESFTPGERTDMPMLIREHARKYQWTVVEAGLWVRRASSTGG
jgi:putative 4-mercaptohistidine N1-methyltranferase